MRLPAGFLETIIEFRAYTATKAAFDAKKRKNPHETPLWDEVKHMTFAIEKERRANGG